MHLPITCCWLLWFCSRARYLSIYCLWPRLGKGSHSLTFLWSLCTFWSFHCVSHGSHKLMFVIPGEVAHSLPVFDLKLPLLLCRVCVWVFFLCALSVCYHSYLFILLPAQIKMRLPPITESGWTPGFHCKSLKNQERLFGRKKAINKHYHFMCWSFASFL